MSASLEELRIADSAAAWAACGFAVVDETCVVGETRIRFLERGGGIAGWSLRGVEAGALDGLPTARSDGPPPGDGPAHPNGVAGLDHVVAISPDLDRTVAALRRAGLDLRRLREEPTPAGAPRQAFFRLGAAILEVVQEPPEAIGRGGGRDRPAFFWGLAFSPRTWRRPSPSWERGRERSATRSSRAAGSRHFAAPPASACRSP